MNSRFKKIITSNLCFEYLTGGEFEVGNNPRNWESNPFDLVLCLTKGSIKVETTDKGTININANDCLFLPAHKKWKCSFYSEDNLNRLINIKFHFKCLNAMNFLSFFDVQRHITGKSAAAISKIISNLHDLGNNSSIPEINKHVEHVKCGFKLLSILLKNSELNNIKAKILKYHDKLPELLANLKANPKECKTVEDMANVLNLSKPRVHQVFKEFTGYAPVEYCRLLRLEKAAEMLLTTNYKIFEIAKMVGYQDQFTFSKSFKKHFGVSPSKISKDF